MEKAGGPMDYPIIRKDVSKLRVTPNLRDYAELRSSFSWRDLQRELDGLPGGGLNLAYEAVDRHCAQGRGGKLALIWAGKNGEEERYSYEQLRQASNRCANVFRSLGVKKGDRVFFFMERVPELYFAVLGTLKLGAVVGPLFSAFGPDPVRDRLADAGASVLVTQPELRRRIAGILPGLPELKHVVVANKLGRSREPLTGGDLAFEELVSRAPAEFGPIQTTPDDYSIMHYTSGTTGKPKGAAHAHQAVLGHYMTGKYVLDLHPDDIYWCTADPGWVTGTSYGISAPWTNGVTQVIYEGGFRASMWYETIQKYKVTVWYTAPTAVRMLMKAGSDLPRRYNLASLRHINSVGEPLNPEAIMWGLPVFGQAIHDNWWQTETGCILIANYAAMDVRPGSMGRPIPGVDIGVLDDQYREVPPGQDGHLAVRPGWPAMFRTYWNAEERYRSRFQNGWYITGDRARRDADGYVWFVGRADDVIN
ncbi:MAG: AMP-binding protein, partial [SAR202 cluster bacterium]|nr:AMP-binding protein [SAR202 cluster bacterium]